MALTSCVFSTQCTKCAAKNVANAPFEGCAPPSIPAPAFLVDFLPPGRRRAVTDGTQQQLAPRSGWPLADKFRSRRAECIKLHSAKHRKCAGEGQNNQSGTRSNSDGAEALPEPRAG
eukprot:CAMPEP_0198589564 /NCGR_PEP_ID=MMETSP1462-20131121/134563_1 /TAXON_ID=1333877 /ORGANISM="Brandtodinium nutriculum, Strain RCC3387" /LENGTH=116 /DNA_ID=CAMNT_0044321083 /DNA_START=83 /DNA_END=430 /DNA_ORIENTATION=-